ncbi:MAG TPA: hypothetical protein DHS57_02850 [Erysipelotrichaceae bacterium]|jgi:hypothetical protein|nr:DUF6273 domain-containing protein [Bacilli bacterium]NLJ32617.1 hypothetical protein [Erysipelotrichaceae bacterium]HCY06230.1 hypothetical protein [Erysipelotrichaceae bacterium]
MKKRSLIIFTLLGLLLSSCSKTPSTSTTSEDVIPTSMSASVNSITLEANETIDLNEHVTFTFEPSDTPNKDVIWLADAGPHLELEGSMLTALEAGNSGLLATSVANPALTSRISVNILPATYPVSVTPGEGFTVTGLSERYNEGAIVTFTVTVTDETKELDYVAISDPDTVFISKDPHKFRMPACAITLTVVLKELGASYGYSLYNIRFDLGEYKTPRPLETSEDVLATFVHEQPSEEYITGVAGFEKLYGGGRGGSGETLWYTGDMLKFGTTSVNGYISLTLNEVIDKIKLTGYTTKVTNKIRVGDAYSSDWETPDSDNKTTLFTLSELPISDKTNVEAGNDGTVEISFTPTSNLKIAMTNKVPFYLTKLELIKAGEGGSVDPGIPSYTVTWKNYNDDILKIDEEVAHGTIPNYNGPTPSKPDEGDNSFIHSGWTPEIVAVTADATYTATFVVKDIGDGSTPNALPIIASDFKSVEYGFYPQTVVTNNSDIIQLNAIEIPSVNGWYLYHSNYYTKVVANVYNNESYTFNDWTPIVNGKEYWFKCERIKWDVISSSESSYTLLSSVLLDSRAFYSSSNNRTIEGSTIYPNNYKESDLRSWLNNDFFSSAFALHNTSIASTNINNGAATTDKVPNQYASPNTTDKVFLLSYQDYLDVNYGFEAENALSSTRVCKTTDFARATGSYVNYVDSDSLNNGTYWTRSPSSKYSYAVWNVNSGGYLSAYPIDSQSHSVRPCVTFNF